MRASTERGRDADVRSDHTVRFVPWIASAGKPV